MRSLTEAPKSYTSKAESLHSSASKINTSRSQTTVYTEGDLSGKARSETTRSPAPGTDGNTIFTILQTRNSWGIDSSAIRPIRRPLIPHPKAHNRISVHGSRISETQIE